MSINSAMLAGASGMRANSSALAAISDNIANVNTVGYKRLRNDFTSLLNAQNRQTTYNAGGVSSRSSPLMSEQGSSIASSVATHLAVSGNGFFVVRGRSDDATSASESDLDPIEDSFRSILKLPQSGRAGSNQARSKGQTRRPHNQLASADARSKADCADLMTLCSPYYLSSRSASSKRLPPSQ